MSAAARRFTQFRGRLPLGGARGVASFFDGAADSSQVLAEAQRGCLLALGEVGIELDLAAQGVAGADPVGLALLGANASRVPGGDTPAPPGGCPAGRRAVSRAHSAPG